MKFKDRISKKIAYLLPRRILYWCMIRSWAITTTEKYPDKDPFQVNWKMVCNHLMRKE